MEGGPAAGALTVKNRPEGGPARSTCISVEVVRRSARLWQVLGRDVELEDRYA